jgi:hypothetical protein
MHAQIVPDTDAHLNLLSLMCPAERREVSVLTAVKRRVLYVIL